MRKKRSKQANLRTDAYAIKWLIEHKDHSRGCLDWPFFRAPNGYGKVTFQGRPMAASRAMCILAHGPPPTADAVAAHSCGRGHQGCMSPVCVRWATPKENVADSFQHGTFALGERNGKSLLTTDQVVAIRADERSLRKIGADYGVSYTTIEAIKRRRSWAHVA